VRIPRASNLIKPDVFRDQEDLDIVTTPRALLDDDVIANVLDAVCAE
jgi:hypothetical protein